MANSQQSKRDRRDQARRERAEALKAAQRRQQYTRLAYGIGAVAAVAVVVVVMMTLGKGAGNPAPAGSVTVSGPARSEPLAQGDAVPSFTAPALTGNGTVDWSTYAGQKVVLSVWAPWCPHCQTELPVLSRVVATYSDVSLVTITTAVGQEPGPSPEQYMKDNNLSFPVAVDDADGTLAGAFGIQAFPTVYFVNSDGTVASEQEGEIPEADLQQLIESLT
jgi:thiol-disulfide isomerase/thioredoxin